MAAQNYTIKTMTRSELDLAIDWAASEGWNPGRYDADCFYAADPNGFLMGWLQDEPIASISVVKYGASFGFLGFYIVKPEFRGLGYGFQIWQAGLNYLQGCNIGLDGVVAQQDNYLKSGFKLAYRNIRYEGRGDGVAAAPQAELVPLTSLPIDTVIEYDRPFFPDDRTAFLKRWLAQPDCVEIGLMHDQSLAGYGVLRVCRSGYKIGPLFADTPQFADVLFLALKSKVPSGSPFYLDVPEINAPAIALAERHHMHSMFETARMYTQQPPQLPLDRLFGVTTFELG
ncbi:MAG: GNAT family N-acetyltransferase [Leptolyngbya sp. SIO1E4]|nr:GNAT family N-acetyltransferase [Leptolyngbya sp. SIO1E4]